MKVTDGGKEQHVPAGFIDITAEDEHGTTVVLELKAGTADRETIGQILAAAGDERPTPLTIAQRIRAAVEVSGLTNGNFATEMGRDVKTLGDATSPTKPRASAPRRRKLRRVQCRRWATGHGSRIVSMAASGGAAVTGFRTHYDTTALPRRDQATGIFSRTWQSLRCPG